MRKYIVLLLALTFILGSCRHFMGRRVRGNGVVKTEERSVTSFKDVEVHGAINVHISQGDTKAVKITGDENLLPYVEVTQEGDRLIIDERHGYNLDPSTEMIIYVSSPVYNNIHLSGVSTISGDTKISGSENLEVGLSGAGNIKLEVDVPKVTADISGVGSMYLQGQTKDVDLSLSGAGSAHCYELMSENTTANVSGVGSAEVYASVKIDAHVSGVGSIKYKGNATAVEQQVSGVGSIKKEP